MVRSSMVRGAASASLIVAVVGVGAAALHAQPGGRSPAASRLADFPEAQQALAAAQVDEMSALNSMLTTLENGEVTFYFSTARLKADATARTTLVRSLGAVLPRVVDSQMFRDMYARVREEAATSAIGEPPQDPSVGRADTITQAQMGIRDLQDQLRAPNLDRRARSALQEALDAAQAAVARMQREAQDPAVRAREQAVLAEAQADYQARRTEAQAELEARLPTDVRQLVADRLQGFVTGCRDVNFRARTVGSGASYGFADPAVEGRPKLWKLCFRAGQRTVTEARRVATSWLGQLQRAGIRPRTP